MDEGAFKAKVARILAYIRSGDCKQVFLSRRFFCKYIDSPINFYRTLCTINRSSFLIYHHFRDVIVVGSSPKIFVRKLGSQLIMRPLAGTSSKKGLTQEEDEQNAQVLLNDEKREQSM